MITQTQVQKVNYVARLAVLPLLIFLVGACGRHEVVSSPATTVAVSDTIPQSDFKTSDIITVHAYRDDDSGSVALRIPETKPETAKPADTQERRNPPVDDQIIKKLEIEASYPGGITAWKRYLARKLRYPEAARQKKVQGLVVVRFLVDKEGKLSNVHAISGPEGLGDVAVEAIRNSGPWLPGIQDGIKVHSYKTQPVSFMLETKPVL